MPEFESLTDEQLIKASLEGNMKAFGEIVRRYEPRVAATVIGMLGNRGESDDIGQETFIRFYKSMHRFRGESSLGWYLTRIAMNLSLNEIKKKKRLRFFFSSADDAGKEAVSAHAPDIETTAAVRAAIQQLAPEFRSVVVLRMIDGYSTQEAAGILKIPLGTALSRLARAQKKLKELLAPFKKELE